MAAPQIHPSAFVAPTAQLGDDVVVGPCAVIEDDVVIGARTRIDAFAKAGIRCKSMTLARGAVQLSEDMKFAKIDFDEVMDEDVSWEDSAAKECFEGRFLCAV